MRNKKKKKVGKQRINYEIIDWQENEQLPDNSIRKTVENHLKARAQETFDSLPIENQVNSTLIASTIVSLEQIRLDILSTLKPKDTFKHELELLITSRYFDLYRIWLKEFCNKYNVGEQMLQTLYSTQNRLLEYLSDINC